MKYQPFTYYAPIFQNTACFIFTAYMLVATSCREKPVENTDHTAHVDSIMAVSDELHNNIQPHKSIEYLDSAYKAILNPSPMDLWRKYRQKAGYHLTYEFNTAKALLYTDSMSMVLAKTGERPEELNARATTYFTYGDLYMAEKKYTKAFQYYYDGRVFARKNLDFCSYSQFTYQLGLARYRQREFLQAIPYFRQAIAENSNCKAAPGTNNAFYFAQTTLNTLALCFERVGRLDSAAYYYQHTLKLIRQQVMLRPDDKKFAQTAIGVVYGNMGGVYIKTKNYTEAEQYLKESIRINDKAGYEIGDAQTAKLKLADLYIRLARYKAADTLLKQLERYITQRATQLQPNDEIRTKWTQLKWAYYDRTKQTALAYAFVQRYNALRDSINAAAKGLDNTDMDAAFKVSEQQYKVSLLSKDNQVKKYFLSGIVSAALLCVGILLFIWYNLKRTQRYVAELLSLNHRVIAQNGQMQRALNALEQSQADNTRIMQIVAHDLRTPIGGITSIASVLLEDETQTEDNRMMLELIKTSGKHSLDMVSDLLQIHTRIEDLKMEPVMLDTLLHNCVDLLHHKAEAKGQRIELQTIPINISASGEKLWRVVSNLVANAIKFSPSGAGIVVGLKSIAGFAVIFVKDRGIGIPEDIKDKIFDMLSEARRTGTDGEQPFGMGLAISRQIVEAHGGRIWFESSPDEGTIFFAELPLN